MIKRGSLTRSLKFFEILLGFVFGSSTSWFQKGQQSEFLFRRILLTYKLKLFSMHDLITFGLFSMHDLKVPKREIFDRSDFPDFYTIKSLHVGDFGVKIIKKFANI